MTASATKKLTATPVATTHPTDPQHLKHKSGNKQQNSFNPVDENKKQHDGTEKNSLIRVITLIIKSTDSFFCCMELEEMVVGRVQFRSFVLNLHCILTW